MKRTLKELLALHFRVRANPLSYNTAVGVPLAILGCDVDTNHVIGIARGFARAASAALLNDDRVDVMVLEFGVRHAGDMHAHLQIVRPDTVIVTPLTPCYGEDCDNQAVLRREIETLCAGRQRDGLPALFLPADDPMLEKLAGETPNATLFAARDVEHHGGEVTLRIDNEALRVTRDTVGASGRRALAAGVRVGRQLGMAQEQIQAFLSVSPSVSG